MSTHSLNQLKYFGNRLIFVALLTVVGMTMTCGLEKSIIERPDSAALDRSSTARWQSLFSENPAWVNRQVAFLETQQVDLGLSLLLGRLLYRGEAWTRRENESVNALRWRQDTIKVKLAILRALRARQEPEIVDYICRYLTTEQEPELVISALSTLALLDSNIAPSWAFRLADPRAQRALPGAQSASVRQQALTFVLETRGIEAEETQRAFDWGLLRVSGPERNHAIYLLSGQKAPELRRTVTLKLIDEYRSKVIDSVGKDGLVLAIGDLSGYADDTLVSALMAMVINGERIIATTAATALATTLSWDAPVAINDLITRAQKDPDPVVRHSLLAFLMRLDPSAVADISSTTSPWSALANHHHLLQQWSAPTLPPLPPAPKTAPPKPKN